MSRALKYLEGEKFGDPIDVVREILASRYVIDRGKRQHPGWMISMPLHEIAKRTRSGFLRKAIPNPNHPDNKE